MKIKIVRMKAKGNNLGRCGICGKSIKEGDEIALIKISSLYRMPKDFVVFHSGCFIDTIQKLFKDYISLTKKGKSRIIIRKV